VACRRRGCLGGACLSDGRAGQLDLRALVVDVNGVKHAAPYFHDNSSKSLEDVMDQYVFFFTSNIGFPITDSNILLTQQDIDDIIAFLRLL
jgi:hypothetical protein